MPSLSPSYRKRFKVVDTMPYCISVSIAKSFPISSGQNFTTRCYKIQYILFYFYGKMRNHFGVFNELEKHELKVA